MPWPVAVAVGATGLVVCWAILPALGTGLWAPTIALLSRTLGGLLFGALILGGLIGEARRRADRRRFGRVTTLDAIRSLSWRDFEGYVADAYRRLGYQSRITNDGPDGGVDVVAERAGEVTYVQCKHWRQRVGVRVVRELKGAMATHSVERGSVLSLEGFTVEACSLARLAGITLLDAADIRELLRSSLEASAPSTAADRPARFVESAPACPRCGRGMVRRTARSGVHTGKPFWGCPGFPSCRGLVR